MMSSLTPSQQIVVDEIADDQKREIMRKMMEKANELRELRRASEE